MASIRPEHRRGRRQYEVIWRDAANLKRHKYCDTKAEAKKHLKRALEEEEQRSVPLVDPRITLADYAQRWLGPYAAARALQPATITSYEATLRLHILPAIVGAGEIGRVPMRKFTRALAKTLLTDKLAGSSRDSVRIMHAVLSALCQGAVDDGLLVANPVAGLLDALQLKRRGQRTKQDVKAFTQAELDQFLATARTHSALADFYLVLARTGLRLGEGLALTDAALDLDRRTAAIDWQLTRTGALKPPKSGYGREVDLSQETVAAWQARIVAKKVAKLKHGWPEVPAFSFVTSHGTPYGHRNVLRDFKAVLVAAKLPRHFSPHSLRHTFATLHLLHATGHAANVLAYLQQQLGHSSIKLTVDTYGSWLRTRLPEVADAQDTRSKLATTVATTATSAATI